MIVLFTSLFLQSLSDHASRDGGGDGILDEIGPSLALSDHCFKSVDSVGYLVVKLLQVTVDEWKHEDGEGCQHDQEDISEVHLGLEPADEEKHSGLGKDEEGGDVGSEGVVFEVDAHRLYSLGVPFELAILNNVLVVHLWRPDALPHVVQSHHHAHEEDQQDESVGQKCEGDTFTLEINTVSILHGEIIICHSRHDGEHDKHDHIHRHNECDSRLQTENEAAVPSLGDVVRACQ